MKEERLAGQVQRMPRLSGKDAAHFFAECVKKRRPCVLEGFDDEDWKGDVWDFDYLKQKAGDAEVQVELKGKNGAFGNADPRVRMKFESFLTKLEKGETSMYLTTQYEDEDDETQFPPPTNFLRSDFPAVPKLLGNLRLQQVNLWIGHSPAETSSGLHHDFHDNLYILLRGSKRFTLYPPQDADKMYLHGQVQTIHPNGLICYQNGPSVRSDGATLEEVAKWKFDNFQDSNGNILQMEVTESQSEDDEVDLNALLQRAQDGDIAGFDDVNLGDGDLSGDDSEENETEGTKEPDSFSKIPSSALRLDPPGGKEFPLLAKARKEEVTLTAGSALYLPASWFHEVRSSGVHVAFNYWLKPPSHPLTSSFAQPYEDNYWESKSDNASTKGKKRKRGT
eukprot:TRINITY_DN981_c0_g1_i1.p2 TRINITY_DN981_c0_g1~~TRINITY_DN981_c0_g1_i1.p2  ORF type:complete len:402 (+),score=77.14 TRINITY_DN981_c0_g1_i1:29-1207(+)